MKHVIEQAQSSAFPWGWIPKTPGQCAAIIDDLSELDFSLVLHLTIN